MDFSSSYDKCVTTRLQRVYDTRFPYVGQTYVSEILYKRYVSKDLKRNLLSVNEQILLERGFRLSIYMMSKKILCDVTLSMWGPVLTHNLVTVRDTKK